VLTPPLAHAGRPVAPHDLWAAWNLDPVLLAAMALAVWLYRRGRAPWSRPVDRWRERAFVGALAVLVVALVSPLEALSDALASAHMVQHLLLIVVAAPLLAFSAPGSALLRGSPVAVRRVRGRVRRSGIPSGILHAPDHPLVVWSLHVAVVWLWHSRVAYDAALASTPLHIAEHLTFLVTAVLFWRVVLGVRRSGWVSQGMVVLLVFGMAMQSVFLALLMTFATEPWYAGYADTTAAWGLGHLADQHLAGVIMWIPAGAIYVAAALGALASWMRSVEAEA
jgi:putative membrane protein